MLTMERRDGSCAFPYDVSRCVGIGGVFSEIYRRLKRSGCGSTSEEEEVTASARLRDEVLVGFKEQQSDVAPYCDLPAWGIMGFGLMSSMTKRLLVSFLLVLLWSVIRAPPAEALEKIIEFIVPSYQNAAKVMGRREPPSPPHGPVVASYVDSDVILVNERAGDVPNRFYADGEYAGGVSKKLVKNQEQLESENSGDRRWDTIREAIHDIPDDAIPYFIPVQESSDSRMIGNVEYECPFGFKLEGGRCAQTVYREPVFSCPYGSYRSAQRECMQVDSVPPEYVCPKGYEYFFRGCIRRTRIYPVLSCPNGYTQYDELCLEGGKVRAKAACPEDFYLVGPKNRSRVGRNVPLGEEEPPASEDDSLPRCVRQREIEADVECPADTDSIPLSLELLELEDLFDRDSLLPFKSTDPVCLQREIIDPELVCPDSYDYFPKVNQSLVNSMLKEIRTRAAADTDSKEQKGLAVEEFKTGKTAAQKRILGLRRSLGRGEAVSHRNGRSLEALSSGFVDFGWAAGSSHSGLVGGQNHENADTHERTDSLDEGLVQASGDGHYSKEPLEEVKMENSASVSKKLPDDRGKVDVDAMVSEQEGGSRTRTVTVATTTIAGDALDFLVDFSYLSNQQKLPLLGALDSHLMPSPILTPTPSLPVADAWLSASPASERHEDALLFSNVPLSQESESPALLIGSSAPYTSGQPHSFPLFDATDKKTLSVDHHSSNGEQHSTDENELFLDGMGLKASLRRENRKREREEEREKQQQKGKETGKEEELLLKPSPVASAPSLVTKTASKLPRSQPSSGTFSTTTAKLQTLSTTVIAKDSAATATRERSATRGNQEEKAQTTTSGPPTTAKTSTVGKQERKAVTTGKALEKKEGEGSSRATRPAATSRSSVTTIAGVKKAESKRGPEASTPGKAAQSKASRAQPELEDEQISLEDLAKEVFNPALFPAGICVKKRVNVTEVKWVPEEQLHIALGDGAVLVDEEQMTTLNTLPSVLQPGAACPSGLTPSCGNTKIDVVYAKYANATKAKSTSTAKPKSKRILKASEVESALGQILTFGNVLRQHSTYSTVGLIGRRRLAPDPSEMKELPSYRASLGETGVKGAGKTGSSKTKAVKAADTTLVTKPPTLVDPSICSKPVCTKYNAILGKWKCPDENYILKFVPVEPFLDPVIFPNASLSRRLEGTAAPLYAAVCESIEEIKPDLQCPLRNQTASKTGYCESLLTLPVTAKCPDGFHLGPQIARRRLVSQRALDGEEVERGDTYDRGNGRLLNDHRNDSEKEKDAKVDNEGFESNDALLGTKLRAAMTRALGAVAKKYTVKKEVPMETHIDMFQGLCERIEISDYQQICPDGYERERPISTRKACIANKVVPPTMLCEPGYFMVKRGDAQKCAKTIDAAPAIIPKLPDHTVNATDYHYKVDGPGTGLAMTPPEKQHAETVCRKTKTGGLSCGQEQKYYAATPEKGFYRGERYKAKRDRLVQRNFDRHSQR